MSQRVWADVAKGQEEKSGQRKGGCEEKFPSRQEGSRGSEQTACSLLGLSVACGRGCSGSRITN